MSKKRNLPNRHLRSIAKAVEPFGLKVSVRRNGHAKITDGVNTVFISKTPSDYRAQEKIFSDIRRVFNIEDLKARGKFG